MNPFHSVLRIASLIAVVFAPAIEAQNYPTKPIRIIVPYSPGGQVDLLARTIEPYLQKAWNQPVVIDYKAGAGGIIGMEQASKAAPDGYTLIVADAGNLTVNPH